jgi:nucleoside-triphosphatase
LQQQQRRIIGITGRPGIGKTTLALTIARSVSSAGCSVGGFVTPEVREGGVRRGFIIKSLDGNITLTLATTEPTPGALRVGRYYVNADAGREASELLNASLRSYDVIVVDEVGPMELGLRELRAAIESLLLNISKPVIATFYYRLNEVYPRLYSLLTQGITIYLNEGNRYEYMRRASELARWLVGEACGNKRGEGLTLHT